MLPVDRETKMEILRPKSAEVPMKPVLAFMLIGAMAHNAFAQISRMEPAEPRWSQTITVTYDPHAKGAKFNPTDQIFVVMGLFYEDHVAPSWGKMEKAGDVFRYQCPVKEDLAYIAFHFVTASGWDMEAALGTMIYRKDGVPACGAYTKRMSQPFLDLQYKQWFEKEIALCPDDFSVYPEKWFVASAYDRPFSAATVAEDIKKMSARATGEPANYLHALSAGYLFLGQEPQSRAVLKKMVERFPTSPLTADALRNYAYRVYADQLAGPGPDEVKQLELRLIQMYPGTEGARTLFSFLKGEDQEKIPLLAIKTIIDKWLQDEPDNPMPYYTLAKAYYTRKQEVDSASSLLEKAMNLLLQGKLRLYNDIAGQLTEHYLTDSYMTGARLALAKGDVALALSRVKAAEALASVTPTAAYALEGSIWRQLDNPPRAESAYLQAWQKGSKDALEPLKEIYAARHGNLEGFEQHLKSESVVSGAPTEKKLASQFHVKALDGTELDLAALRGKVVVLNFWSLGCAPCRAEIPELNRLVKDYKDKDVVFIAFGLDGAKEVQESLKELNFSYHLVPDSSAIAAKFDVSVYPKHIVIDKEGRICAVLEGASKTRHDDLQMLIDRALGT
jgi:thiol-disulfide isomerase/thioredoxin